MHAWEVTTNFQHGTMNILSTRCKLTLAKLVVLLRESCISYKLIVVDSVTIASDRVYGYTNKKVFDVTVISPVLSVSEAGVLGSRNAEA